MGRAEVGWFTLVVQSHGDEGGEVWKVDWLAGGLLFKTAIPRCCDIDGAKIVNSGTASVMPSA